jgi:uncharacterized membrane protein (DUF4010 family)
MDAITLSIARQDTLPHAERADAVLLATASNTVMKFLIVLVFGNPNLRRSVGLGFGVTLAATILAVMVR